LASLRNFNFIDQVTDLEFLLLRNPGGKLPTNLLWALCVSLLLHLSLLELRLASDRPAKAREKSGVSLPLTATLLGSRQSVEVEPGSVALENAVEAGETSTESYENSENSAEPTGSQSSSVARDSPSTDGILRLPLPDLEKPVAIQEKPVPMVIPANTAYFRRSELTLPPVLQDEPLIDAPEEMGNGKKKGGKLVLRLFVNASGEVDRVTVDSSSSPTAFEEAAVAAFLPLRFRPGEIDGVAVSSQVVFEIDFDKQALGASRSSDRARWWGNPGKTEKQVSEGRGELNQSSSGVAKPHLPAVK